jgi:ribosomal protein S18 acetylase RimI-like enzyme
MPADSAVGLDNPFWASLATRHAALALGGPLARRYPPGISPIAGLPAAAPANIATLEALVHPGDDAGVAGPFVLELPSHWETLHRSRLIQMVRDDRAPMPEQEIGAMVLGASDVDDMLALAELTKPGPFRPRTIELGTYLGVRDNGRLVAMAGQRLWIGTAREISAVCTDPAFEGRGMARALVARQVNLILRAGETPFLHVDIENPRAIELYRGLGFVPRAELPLLAARRVR